MSILISKLFIYIVAFIIIRYTFRFYFGKTVIFKKKPIVLGKGKIYQTTIIENKSFGGIWIYDWENVDQNRFHTHAFSSYAILLSGSYTEEVIIDGRIVEKRVKDIGLIRKLPHDYCHRITYAEPNTKTIVFFGKWNSTWLEYFQDTSTWVRYKWGRKVDAKLKYKLIRSFSVKDDLKDLIIIINKLMDVNKSKPKDPKLPL